MCKTFFDVRTFGAVMSLKSAPNCGQDATHSIYFARSVEPGCCSEHSITRMAVATEPKPKSRVVIIVLWGASLPFPMVSIVLTGLFPLIWLRKQVFLKMILIFLESIKRNV